MLKLLDLSGKVDESSVSLYEDLTDVASSIGVSFFLMGATARDIILEKGFRIPATRATRDVDIGVRVSGWNEYDKLKQALLDSGHFAATREVQRLSYRGEMLVDILPFGQIADPGHKISWPPGHDFVMSTVGFEEAYEAAQLVRVRAHPPLDIRVASPAGLAILKIIAWADSPSERSKDAHDLALVMETYLDAGNHERLLEEHQDLMNVDDFDYTRAASRLLGRDIGRIANPETRARIQETLRRGTGDAGEYLLVQQIVQHTAMAGEEESRFEHVRACLRELDAGIDEAG